MLNKVVLKILASPFLGAGVIFSTYLYSILINGGAEPGFFLFTNFILFLISMYMIYYGGSGLFLRKMVGLFFLIFFSISPVLEHNLKISYWGGRFPYEADFVNANLLLIVSLLCFDFLYILIGKSGFGKGLYGDLSQRQVVPTRFFPLVFLSCVFAFVAFHNYDYNLVSMLLRGGGFVDNLDMQKSTKLIVDVFVRPLPMSVVIYYFYMSGGNVSKYLFAILLAIGIFTCFPSGIARFAVAAVYIPIFFVAFNGFVRYRFLWINLFILIFMTVFPLLHNFRYLGEDTKIDDFKYGLSFYTQGHFDAFQNLVNTINVDLITHGSQLLGAILFFVPRVIWPNKPDGSGKLLANTIGLNFDNLSQSLPAEGYINFGVFGAILFMSIIGILFSMLDRGYGLRSQLSVQRSIFDLMYFQLIGLSFFILRGDLLNSIAYTCGIISSLFFVHVFVLFARLKFRFLD